MHFKQNRGEKFVHFCQDYISYSFNGYKHTLTHYPTIRYMYHLMSLMTCVSWIRVVVKKCYDIVIPSLTEMNLKKLKFILGRKESTMRRMLDPPFTTCKYFLHYRSAIHSAKYVEKFISYVKENYHRNMCTTNISMKMIEEQFTSRIFSCMVCFLNSILGFH